MSLGVSIAVRAAPPKSREDRTLRVADQIMFERLQNAILRIKRQWPIDTGRSFAAWAVFREGPLSYRVINQARTEDGEYAGYVFRKGDPNRTPLATTMVRDEIQRAVKEIRVDFAEFKATGRKTTLPSLSETIADRLRAAIAEKLLARSSARVVQTRTRIAA